MRLWWIGMLMGMAACAKERPPAPDDLDGMSHFLFKYWEDEDQLRDGMTALGGWLETNGRDEEATHFGFVLTGLTPEEVVETPHPDHGLDRLIGVALTGVSPFSVEAHGELIVLEDQRWKSAKTYIEYERTLIEGTAGSFVPPNGLVRTHNFIDKSGPFGIHIPYELNKNFRWVVTDEGKQAVIARSWVDTEGCNGADGDGKNCVSLSFSIDLWYGSAEDETIRLTSTWNYLRTSVDELLTDEFLVKTMVNGLQDVYTNTDAVLAGDD